MPVDEVDVPTTVAVDPLEHQGLVFEIARMYRCRGIGLRDLVSEGQIGLLIACRRFDPGRGFRFATYACHWIRKTILEAIRNHPRPLRIPLDVLTARANVRNGKVRQDELIPGLRRRIEAADHVLCRRTLADPEVVGRCHVDRRRAGGDRGLSPGTEELLRVLTPAERAVVSSRHGLGGVGEDSWGEIAGRMGVTPQRVRVIYRAALGRMRLHRRATSRAAS
jgi:RNA polymerase primary sigma factor